MWNFSSGGTVTLQITDQYIDNPGPTQRLIFKAQSLNGAGGILAMMKTTFQLTGGGEIGQMLGDTNGDGVEDDPVNSYIDYLNAVENLIDFGGNFDYKQDSHSLRAFGTMLYGQYDNPSPSPDVRYISTCGQTNMTPDFSLGTTSPVSIVQVVIPDGVALGAGLGGLGGPS